MKSVSEQKSSALLVKTVPDSILVVTQVLAYIFCALPLRIWYRALRTLPNNLHQLVRGSLILSNHQSMADPFFVLACVPVRVFLRILPIRFPTADFIYKSKFYNPRFFPFITLLGCFSIGSTSIERMRTIFYIRTQLKAGYTIFLFPEGEITKEQNVKELKEGVDFFMHDAKSVMFVRLHGLNRYGRMRRQRGRCRVTFGEVFTHAPSMTIEEMHRYLDHL